MEYALIKNDTVVNVIVADDDFITTIEKDYDRIECIDTQEEIAANVGIGFTWEKDKLPVAPTVEIITPDPIKRIVSKLAFRRRFTKTERDTIEWAAIDNPSASEEQRKMAASLRTTLKDQEMADHIDLDDGEVQSGVANLSLFGLIQSTRVDEILNSPIQESEKP